MKRWEWILLVLVLLVGLFFRIYQLDSAPPGMTHDEADTGYFFASVYRGERSEVDVPYGYANEPFAMYSGALFMHLFGPNELAMRLHGVFFNLLMLLFLFLWARRAFGYWVALGAVALFAVSFWPVSTARFALNWQPAAALFTGAVWLLWLGLAPDETGDARPGSDRWWVWPLAALCLAGSVWSYEVGRATIVVPVAWGVYILATQRALLRKRGWWFLAALVLGLGLAAPHLLDPAAWQRSSTLATTWRDLLAGDPGPIISSSLEAFGAFTVEGDPFITYNIPGRPVFGPLVGLLFYVGVAISLWRWRQPAYALVLLWLAFGLAPVMVVGVWNFTSHGMGMQAVAFLPPALAAVEIGRWAKKQFGERVERAAGVVFVIVVLTVAVITFRDYFLQWSRWPEVQDAYFHDLAQATDYMNDEAAAGTIGLSSPFPDLTHDPFIADLRVQRQDLEIGWFDGRMALLYPAQHSGELLLLEDAPLNAALRPDGLKVWQERPGFCIFRWDPLAERDALLASWGEGTDPANFGGAVALLGTSLPAESSQGQVVEVASMWQVLDPAGLGPVPAGAYDRSFAIFVHLLDETGALVTQDDRLDVPAWNWRTGDAFVQLHRLEIPAELAAGEYQLRMGLYSRADLTRLPVTGGGDSWPVGVIQVQTP